jgi:hypothetical protein
MQLDVLAKRDEYNMRGWKFEQKSYKYTYLCHIVIVPIEKTTTPLLVLFYYEFVLRSSWSWCGIINNNYYIFSLRRSFVRSSSLLHFFIHHQLKNFNDCCCCVVL